jgi:predicted nucleic acid-binding protein
MNLTKARLGPKYAITFGRQLKNSQAFYPLALTDIDKRATWDIFAQHQDKQWSYVDCSLLAVAQRLKVKKIFAFDHHFEQMELEIIPRILSDGSLLF